MLSIILRPLIDAALTAFGHLLLDWLRMWRAEEITKALGRAEAERDAAKVAADIEREMGAVELPERDGLLKRLREGSA